MTPRTDAHRRIVDDITHHSVAEVADALRRLMDARPALPGAASTDGTRGRGGSSSVEAIALSPDPVAAEIRDLDRVLRRMAVDALWLRTLVGRWLPHTPTPKDLREVERANTPEDGCEHHAAHVGTVAGNLALPMRLCDFCYREVYRKGTLPRGETLILRHVTGKDPLVKVS